MHVTVKRAFDRRCKLPFHFCPLPWKHLGGGCSRIGARATLAARSGHPGGSCCSGVCKGGAATDGTLQSQHSAVRLRSTTTAPVLDQGQHTDEQRVMSLD